MVSNRTSGSKPAVRHRVMAQCRAVVPSGSIAQGCFSRERINDAHGRTLLPVDPHRPGVAGAARDERLA